MKKLFLILSLLAILLLPILANAHTPKYVRLGSFVSTKGARYTDYYDATTIHNGKNNIVGVAVKQVFSPTGEVRYYAFVVSCNGHVYEWGRVINAYTPNPKVTYMSGIQHVHPGTDGATLESLLCST